MIVIIVVVIVTLKYRYNSPTLARLQSFFNPNYNRFDDNNLVNVIMKIMFDDIIFTLVSGELEGIDKEQMKTDVFYYCKVVNKV